MGLMICLISFQPFSQGGANYIHQNTRLGAIAPSQCIFFFYTKQWLGPYAPNKCAHTRAIAPSKWDVVLPSVLVCVISAALPTICKVS